MSGTLFYKVAAVSVTLIPFSSAFLLFNYIVQDLFSSKYNKTWIKNRHFNAIFVTRNNCVTGYKELILRWYSGLIMEGHFRTLFLYIGIKTGELE